MEEGDKLMKNKRKEVVREVWEELGEFEVTKAKEEQLMHLSSTLGIGERTIRIHSRKCLLDLAIRGLLVSSPSLVKITVDWEAR